MKPSRLPIRWRLTLWYLLSFTAILLLFAGFLYWQVQRSLLAQIDSGLQLAATQALVNVDGDNGRLAFQNLENSPQLGSRLSDDIGIYLLSPQGAVWQKLGHDEEMPQLFPVAGLQTINDKDDRWRVYGEAIDLPEQPGGWLMMVQSLEPVTTTLLALSLQLLWGLPLALLLAGTGGYFLAGRTLRPIDDITRTAQVIHASDLKQRLHHVGPADEVGRLADTFDAMLDRLEAAFIRERRFTGDAAHELRTPLTALKGRIGVTLSQPRQPQQYVDTLQEMEGQVDRLIRLSSDLLFMARLDQGQMAQQWERIDVQDFLGAMVDQIQPLAAAKAIVISQTIPTALTLQGDMDLLIRLFLNLLDNAVKYTPENGRITIHANQDTTDLRITITDTGPGIATEHLPYLFERFYRVETARSRNGTEAGGAGLGLAIAHEIARAHGAQLQVDSQLDQGTTFIIIFPLPKGANLSL
ncbi:MAG: HAMP domain-containing protein [Anaerolineales bacterium]|nr:HAMP domain-containing protein [Anaerolineales bacterium]